jgi:hypothetical protein
MVKEGSDKHSEVFYCNTHDDQNVPDDHLNGQINVDIDYFYRSVSNLRSL